MAQVREDGESFFSPEFSAYVFLTDGTSFSFVRAIEGWTWCQYIDEESDGEEVGLGEISVNTGILEDALNQLLTETNVRNNYFSDN